MSQSKAKRLTPLEWQGRYQEGRGEVVSFYAGRCWDWQKCVAARGEFEALREEEIAEWRGFLLGHGAEERHLAPLERLGDPQALTVVTGQQPVAALGPLYVVYKAFAARAWAREVESETGRACIPVFWVASDDHDLEEAAPASWLRADGGLSKAVLAGGGVRGNARCLYDVPVDRERAEGLLAALEETTVASEFRPGILDDLRAALVGPEATFESQMVGLLCRWLLPLGIVPLVPRLGFMRQRARRVIGQEVAEPLVSTRLVQEAGERLEASGMTPLLHRSGDEVNFFLEVEGVRGKVSFDGRDIFLVRSPEEDGEQVGEFSRREMEELLEKEPGRFSPNAILRPLVQDSALSTAAYVGGPGEIAYHAQLGELYNYFSIHRPALLPRPNVVLTERKIERAMGKLGVPEKWAAAVSAVELQEQLRKLAEDGLDDGGMEGALGELRAAMEALPHRLGDAAKEQSVAKSLEKLRAHVETGAEKLRERVLHVLRSKDEDKERAREKLLGYLFPGGEMQERAIGVLSPLLIQFGVEVLPKLAEAIDYRKAGMQAVGLHDLVD